MKDVTDNMNEQFKQMVDVHSGAFEPVRTFAGITADAVEQIARKNYAVIGDVLEYSTKQAHLPLSSENLTDVTSGQVAEATAFIELMRSRATDYAAMAQHFSSEMKEASESVSASFK